MFSVLLTTEVKMTSALQWIVDVSFFIRKKDNIWRPEAKNHGKVLGPGLSLTPDSFLDALIKGLLKVLHSWARGRRTLRDTITC